MEKFDPQDAVLTMVRELRSDPKRYQALRKKVLAAKTDKDRARLLIAFSTKDEAIRRRVPAGGDQAANTITITTITTVLVPTTAR